jgi:hypothetical protein
MHSLFENQNVDKIIALTILGMLLLAVYGLWSRVYLDGLVQMESDIELNRKKAGRVSSILAKEAYYQKQIDESKRSYQKKRIFLQSGQASTASSELQNTVKQLINRYSHANILTIKPYPVVRHDDYSEVSVEIRMKDISHAEIQNVLYRIETQLPLILIKELEIVRAQLQYKALVPKTGYQNDLNLTLVVSGFFRTDGGGR